MKKNLPGKQDKLLSSKDKKKLKLDWDQRPEFICPDCGYHKKACVCSVQKPKSTEIITIEASVDFY